jgi:hypothetical protein
MPTIFRVGPFKIQVFADDHLPPHFHIVGPDLEATVEISGLSILKGRRYRRELKPVLDWARENVELLSGERSKLND